jgi:hypothetical protein
MKKAYGRTNHHKAAESGWQCLLNSACAKGTGKTGVAGKHKKGTAAGRTLAELTMVFFGGY